MGRCEDRRREKNFLPPSPLPLPLLQYLHLASLPLSRMPFCLSPSLPKWCSPTCFPKYTCIEDCNKTGHVIVNCTFQSHNVTVNKRLTKKPNGLVCMCIVIISFVFVTAVKDKPNMQNVFCINDSLFCQSTSP